MHSSKDIDKDFFKTKLNKKDPVIFDVGTYDGSDSLEFLEMFEDAKIYAFEADDRSVDVFKKYVGSKPINLVEMALSDKDGYKEFYKSKSETRRHTRHDYEKDWSASSSIKKPDNHLNIFPDIQYGDSIKVPSIKLDTWIKDYLEINKIDIMWVDVNGGEEEFLNGGLNTITNMVDYLYIEFNGVGDKKLYENCFTVEEIKNKLPNFEELGIYNFMGNFGNILLRNNRK